MRNYTRITVDLSKDEFTALREAADKEYRHPREQARWLLRQRLGIDEDQQVAPTTPVNGMQNAASGHIRQDLATSSVL